MIPAGDPTENAFQTLLPLLEDGDVVVDGGNSNFRDSQRRAEEASGKSVAFLGRYAEISRQATHRYLDALAVVEDPRLSAQVLDRACNPVPFQGRRRRALNPLSRQDQLLFFAVLRGEHIQRGFYARDIAAHLGLSKSHDPQGQRRRSGRVGRLLQLLRAHGLIAKLPHTRRYRVVDKGFAFMSSAIHIRFKAFPKDMALAA